MRSIVIAISLLAVWTNCDAAPIVFTHQGTGSGSINGNPFANKAFVITAQGDTNNRLFPHSDVISINHSSAQIDISEVGTFAFVTGTRTFENKSSQLVGFSRQPASNGADLFNGPSNAAFATWDMTTSIGPFTGSATLRQWDNSPVNTSGGVLRFDFASVTGTFTAQLVPEPTAAVIGGLGSMGMIAIATNARRRMGSSRNRLSR